MEKWTEEQKKKRENIERRKQEGPDTSVFFSHFTSHIVVSLWEPSGFKSSSPVHERCVLAPPSVQTNITYLNHAERDKNKEVL